MSQLWSRSYSALVSVRSGLSDLSINIMFAVWTHVEDGNLRTQPSRHQLIHLVASPHQLLSHLKVTSIQTMNNAKSKGPRQEAR